MKPTYESFMRTLNATDQRIIESVIAHEKVPPHLRLHVAETLARGERRRREARNPASKLPQPSGDLFDTRGAYLSGKLPCRDRDCDTMVDLEETQSPYCVKHQPAAKRRFVTPGYAAVDLDADLAAAEAVVAELRGSLAEAEGRLEQARVAIENYDRAQGGARR